MTNTSNAVTQTHSEKLNLLRIWREEVDDKRVMRKSEGKDVTDLVVAVSHYDAILKFEQTRA